MITNEHAENVTIVSCANVIGNAIAKGARFNPEFIENLPARSKVRMSLK